MKGGVYMKFTVDIIEKNKIDQNQTKYYALEIKINKQLYSFDFEDMKVKKDLLKLRNQIDIILGYKQLKEIYEDITIENLDKIIDFQVKNDDECSECELKYDYCYDCVISNNNDFVRRYLAKEYKLRNIKDRDFEADLKRIKNIHDSFEGCKPYCKYKEKNCFECAIICDSPLEQLFYIGILKKVLESDLKLQVPIDVDGKILDNKEKNINKLLTVVDFYIEKDNKKLCIYTDGFNYHERTQKQAMRDRNIDRTLQEKGYTVLRYTTKEVQDNIDNITQSIVNMIL